MSFLPVNPLLTENGALVALTPRFGEEKAMPVSLESSEEADIFENFSVIQNDIKISIAGNLKIGTIFGGSTDYNSRAFYFDAIAYIDKYDEQQLGDRVISATRWGIGLRIVLNISQISTEFQFNLSQVTAAIQLGKAEARYEIMGLGIGVDGLTIVLDNISPVADFNYETYKAITDEIVPKLSKYIQENKSALKPQPIAVQLIEPVTVDAVTYGKSVAFAVRAIGKNKSLNTAMLEAGAEYEVDIVKEVYASIVGNIPAEDQPSNNAVQRAREWWRDVR